MDKEEITKLVTSYIAQNQGGLEIENPKCDFKTKWYDLVDIKSSNEFIKDTSAMANTFGLDAIIVIGYDLKTKQFHGSVLSDSKLKDSSEIVGLINKRVDRLFEIKIYDIQIDGNNLSVIHIPTSLDKPHVIRQYQNINKKGELITQEHRIFVRKNTSAMPATKNDLELMFYDRKNIVPEFRLLCNTHHSSIHISMHQNSGGEEYGNHATIKINIIFENVGRRPISIAKIETSFILIEANNIEFSVSSEYNYVNKSIVIHPNEIKEMEVQFNSGYDKELKYGQIMVIVHALNVLKRKIESCLLRCFLTNGEVINTDLVFQKL